MTNATSNPVADIERLSKLALEVAEKVRAHRDLLAQRGMGIPPHAVENLTNISTALSQITKRLDNSQIEIQQLRGLARTT